MGSKFAPGSGPYKWLWDNASRDERIAALHTATGEPVGRAGDDTSGQVMVASSRSQRKAGFREVMTGSGSFAPRYFRGPKFRLMIPGCFMTLGRDRFNDSRLFHDPGSGPFRVGTV
jgi:hypothetical protein